MLKFAIAATAAVGAVTLSVAPVQAQAQGVNLVENGNFESGGGSLNGWSVTPFTDIRAVKGAAYVNNAGGTGSPEAQANTLASFGPGQAQNFSTLQSTAFSTIAGQVYRLVFNYGQFGGTAGSQQLQYGVIDASSAVLLQGSKTPTFSSTNLDTLFTTFKNNYFVGTGETAKVFFTLVGSPTTNTDGLLDNVVITAVPETATWVMMILGMGMIGGSLRSRRKPLFTAA